MTKELIVAVLGSGYMGRMHAKNLQAHPGVQVTGFCASTLGSAENAAQPFGARAYTDFSEMLDKEKPGALVVALPPYAHHGQVELAAERGIHLLLEKPLALDPDRARSMARAIQDADVKTVMGYQMRFADPIRHLKELLADGSAGQPVLYTASYACNSLHSAWWRDKAKSGGQLIEQAIHLYDMGLHLCGFPTSVSALADNLVHRETPDYTIEDVSAGLLRFESGAIGSITANNAAVPMEWSATFSLVCERLTVRVAGDLSAEFIDTSNPENVQRETVRNTTDIYAAAAQNFVETVRGEASSLAPIEHGLAGFLTVHAAFSSAQAGGQVQSLNL